MATNCLPRRNISKKSFHPENQQVTLQRIASAGRLLDIGGGGEGTIGRLEGSNIVAIDSRKSELLEAPDGPLKIVMDARDLQFLDETFDTVTSFFTLMYLQKNARMKVLEEAYRVIKPGGQLLIWDAIIPEHHDKTKELFVVYLQINLPDEAIRTGYGVSLKDRTLNLEAVAGLASETGFSLVEQEVHDQVFRLHLKK
ncbi:MAG: class I SAM-dependent methyltransferase [Candidatus Hodarchaeales archaeon]